MPEFTLLEISRMLEGELLGNPDVEIAGISGIDEAQEKDITFLANPKYAFKLTGTGASAVIVSRQTECPGKNLVRVENPYLSFSRLLSAFDTYKPFAGISEQAIIGTGTVIGQEVTIYPGACVGNRVKLGDRVRIHSGAVIDDDAVIGKNSIIYHNVSIYHHCILGERVSVHAGSVIGSDGFGYAQAGGISHKIPQIGIVRIGDDCEIGANVTIDRGTMGETLINEGVKIDNLVQIAHNVQVGAHSIIVAQAGISGSTSLGKGVVLGGQVGVVGHLKLGDRMMAAARAGISKDVPPGVIIGGMEGVPVQEWRRQVASTRRLPETTRKVRRLAKQLEELQQRLTALETDS